MYKKNIYKVHFKQTFNYLRDDEILLTNQSVYHSGDSVFHTVTSLTFVLRFKIEIMSKLYFCYKAFDTVWHARLNITSCQFFIIWEVLLANAR